MKTKCGDINLYQDYTQPGTPPTWVVELYGIGGELVQKAFFGSVDAARYWIIQNTAHSGVNHEN